MVLIFAFFMISIKIFESCAIPIILLKGTSGIFCTIFGPHPAPETGLKAGKDDFDVFHAIYRLLMYGIQRLVTESIDLIKSST